MWLDARHLGAAFLEQRFPSIVARCRELGFDPVTELLPVAPAQHYASGGVETDLLGRSSVDGLYACGECSCTGVHGANRLASNSLLEGLVFAHRIADDVTTRFAAGELPLRDPASDAGDAAVLDASHRLDVQRAMTRGSGPVRTGASTAGALEALAGSRRCRRARPSPGRRRGRRRTCCTSGRRSRWSRTCARRPAAGTCAPTSPTATTPAGSPTSRRPGRPTGPSSSPSGRWRPRHDRPRLPDRRRPAARRARPRRGPRDRHRRHDDGDDPGIPGVGLAPRGAGRRCRRRAAGRRPRAGCRRRAAGQRGRAASSCTWRTATRVVRGDHLGDPARVDPHHARRRAHRPQHAVAHLGRRDAHPSVGRRARGVGRDGARHPQDDPRDARAGEVRRALRWRHQQADGPVRRRDDQGQPQARGGWAHGGVRRGAQHASPTSTCRSR